MDLKFMSYLHSVNIFTVKNLEATIVGFEFHKTLKTKC